jgi:hypothetical protein
VTLASGVSMRIRDLGGLPSVVAHDGLDALVPTVPSVHLPRMGDRECIRLAFSDGRTLTCTPNHRILTKDGTWVEACRLRRGESRVVMGAEVPLYLPSEDCREDLAGFSLPLAGCGRTLRMDEPAAIERAHAFARLLGLFVSERCADRDSLPAHADCMVLGHASDVESVAADVRAVSGDGCRVRIGHRHVTLSLPARVMHDLCTWSGLQRGGGGPYAKLPAFVVRPRCPKSFVREFLGGLFGGGCGMAPSPVARAWRGVGFAGGGGIRALARQVASILHARFEISCGEGSEDGRAALAMPASELAKFAERIGFRHSCLKQARLSAAAAFHRTRGLSDADGAVIGRGVACDGLDAVAGGSAGSEIFRWLAEHGADALFREEEQEAPRPPQPAGLPVWHATFLGAKPAGKHLTFDISVPGSHNFVADGVVVHNCVIAHGAAQVLRDRLFEQSDAYSTPVCRKCGFIAVPERRTQMGGAPAGSVSRRAKPYCRNCRSHDDIREEKLPYAMKLLMQELQGCHLMMRLRFDRRTKGRGSDG